MATEKQNANPTVYSSTVSRNKIKWSDLDLEDGCDWVADYAISSSTPRQRDAFDADEVFEIIRHINDPEHPLTLEQLKVVTVDAVVVDDAQSLVRVQFTPTIPHCNMATLIGLCLRVKLLRSLPSRFKVSVQIAPGTHASEAAVNKQLADKERVAAALENSHLMALVNKCVTAAATPDQ